MNQMDENYTQPAEQTSPPADEQQAVPTGNLKKIIAGLAIAIILIAAAGAGYFFIQNNEDDQAQITADPNPFAQSAEGIAQANKNLAENNTSEAVEQARNAVAAAPDDIDTITNAAEIIAKEDPEAAKELYAHAFKLFIEQNDAAADGKEPLTYWAAGNLAEQAGLLDEAKTYYEKAVAAADPENVNHKLTLEQSQTALERLQ